MNKVLQDIINEEITDHIIDETYKSVNEIKKLASDVIRSIAENNIDQIEKRGQIDYLYGTYLREVDEDKYDEIKNFVKEANISITIQQKEPDSSTRGSYATSMNEPYKPYMEREIEIYVDDLPELFSKINNRVKEEKHFDAGKLYFQLYYELYDTLVHELQHAYDDYRSKGKVYQTKQYKEYLKKNIESQINSDIEMVKKYLNLPHEIWARFSQAMIRTRFTDMNFKNDKAILEMKPVKKVVDDFKRYFAHYDKLSDEMKRKLVNKVVQFWHYEQDNLDDRMRELNKGVER